MKLLLVLIYNIITLGLQFHWEFKFIAFRYKLLISSLKTVIISNTALHIKYKSDYIEIGVVITQSNQFSWTPCIILVQQIRNADCPPRVSSIFSLNYCQHGHQKRQLESSSVKAFFSNFYVWH